MAANNTLKRSSINDSELKNESSYNKTKTTLSHSRNTNQRTFQNTTINNYINYIVLSGNKRKHADNMRQIDKIVHKYDPRRKWKHPNKKRKLNTENASGFESDWNFDADEIKYDDGGDNEEFNEKVRTFFDESDPSSDSETESTGRNNKSTVCTPRGSATDSAKSKSNNSRDGDGSMDNQSKAIMNFLKDESSDIDLPIESNQSAPSTISAISLSVSNPDPSEGMPCSELPTSKTLCIKE